MLIEDVVRLLKNDQVLILPTDTIYGLGANAYSLKAVESVFFFKKRPYSKQLIVLYPSLKMLLNDVEESENLRILADKFWPGPLTIVVKKKKNSKLIHCQETVAVRIPNHPILSPILSAVDFPLVMPSANIADIATEKKFKDIQKIFNLQGIEDDLNVKQVPSTIIDITHDEIKLVRSGIVNIFI